MPLLIATAKLVHCFSIVAEPINTREWELGEFLLAPVTSVNYRTTVYLLSVQEPRYRLFSVVDIASETTGRFQTDRIRLQEPST
jgi:hypothetical protein